MTSPSIPTDGFEIVTTGKWLKSATVKSENFVERDPSADPEHLLAGLRASPLKSDLFAFSQRPPDSTPRFSYPMVWENFAVLPILGYAEWWEKRLNQDTRRCVRVAAKRGLVVRPVQFDDELCRGICAIYNETPIRQGRSFHHFGKKVDAVKAENGTFVERSAFVGAYHEAELVGFLKMVYMGKTASIMQILSKVGHYDRRPMNALMAKAVEICNERQMAYLVYRKYHYYKGLADSLTEFKRRNGFEKMDIPRYYVPLTAKGRLAVSLGLQLGAGHWIPKQVVVAARAIRSHLNRRKGAPE